MVVKFASSVALLAFTRTSLALHKDPQTEEVIIDAHGVISASVPEVDELGVYEPAKLADFQKKMAEAKVGDILSEEYLAQELERDALLSSWFGSTSLTLKFESVDETEDDEDDNDADGEEGDVESTEFIKTTSNVSRSAAEIMRRPTDWKKYWNRPVCQAEKKKARESGYFMWCQKNKPIIYSPVHKFAYMKTPKAASTAMFAYFKKQFPDARVVPADKLPHDTYIFTFVRKPFEQKLAGYAEVNLKQASDEAYGRQQSTKFQGVSRSMNEGRERFRTFLDDIQYRRFKDDDKRKPSHASSQISGTLCTKEVNFIGHLERVTADWKRIQHNAGLPKKLRTKALPVVHEGNNKQYLEDETVPLGEVQKKRICEMYSAEHACLGYSTFDHCAR